MEINPNRPIRPIPKSERKSKVAHAESPLNDSDESTFLGSELLSVIEEGLQGLPEIRQEPLRKARELASDPDYPNEADLEELARLALKNIPRNPEPADEP